MSILFCYHSKFKRILKVRGEGERQMCYVTIRQEGRQTKMRRVPWRNPYAGRGRGQRLPAPLPRPMRYHGPREAFLWRAPGGPGPPPGRPFPLYRNYVPRPRGVFYNGRQPFDGRQEEQRSVKRCLNCNHFSDLNSNLTSCTNCGHQLREFAKLFRDPLAVNAVFRSAIEEVSRNQLGPDFLPLLPPTDEVLESINNSKTLGDVAKSSSSDSRTVVRITSEGPTPVTTTVPQLTTTEAMSQTTPQIRTPAKVSVSLDTNHSQNSGSASSPEIIEIIPSPLTEKEAEPAEPTPAEDINQPSFATTSKGKSKPTNKSKSPSKLIFVPTDDEDESQTRATRSGAASAPRSPKKKRSTEVSQKIPSAIVTESALELEEHTVDSNKLRRKTSKNADTDDGDKNPADDRIEVSSGNEANAVSSKMEKESASNSNGDSTVSTEIRSSSVRDDDFVRLCHMCGFYSFDILKCACHTVFRKKTSNPVLKWGTLSREQQKNVRNANANIGENKKKDDPEPGSVPLDENAPHSLIDANTNDEAQHGEAAQQLENDNNEPALTLGTEEPQQNPDIGFVWEGVTYNGGFSLIGGAPVLGPHGKPTRSDSCGGQRYVWKCPQCSSYRDDLDKCGVCKKKLTKKTRVIPYSTLTNRQIEESKRLERKYIQDKINEKVEKFKRAQQQKFGLFSDAAAATSSMLPDDNSSSNDNETVRKRKSAPQEHERSGPAAPAAKKTKSCKKSC